MELASKVVQIDTKKSSRYRETHCRSVKINTLLGNMNIDAKNDIEEQMNFLISYANKEMLILLLIFVN